jgi:hypothetical protein
MLDRHAEVIRGVGRENIEQLVGSLEFILESVATHPEWRFKGSPPPLDCSWPACSPVAHAELVDTLGFERKRAWLRRRLDELRAVYANHTTDLRVSRTGTRHTHTRMFVLLAAQTLARLKICCRIRAARCFTKGRRRYAGTSQSDSSTRRA